MRIVSLVPSLTETVCDFGLQGSLVGCTAFCVRPPGLHRTAMTIGGTKDPDLAKIRALRPTHILVNEEENKPEHIAMCEQVTETISTFPKRIEDVPAMMRKIGVALTCESAAEGWAANVEGLLSKVKADHARIMLPKRVAYLIWRDPYMLAGLDTYICRALEIIGCENVYVGGERYPQVSISELEVLNPEALLLSSEPYPFRKRDAERLRSVWSNCPPIFWIDGQRMSWYGTSTARLLEEITMWRTTGSSALVKPL